MGKKLIGIVGMPGAGKSLVADYVKQIGYPIVVMGDVIRAKTKERGLNPIPENLGEVMLKIRRDEGQGAVARYCVPKIRKAGSTVVGVDGVRSLEEVEEFKKEFPDFSLIAVHCSPRTRFKRLYARERSDDPVVWTEFLERDLRELKVGLGSVIAMADHMIINEGTKTQLESTTKRLVKRIVQK